MAPEMGNDVEHAYWNTKAGTRRTNTHGARDVEAGIEPIKADKLSMRQLLLRIAGPFPHFAPGPLHPICDAAPEAVNCYTDGGIRFYSTGPAALPGWGGGGAHTSATLCCSMKQC